MTHKPNLPVYYVPYARMIKDVKKPYNGRVLSAGSEFPIHDSEVYQFKKDEIELSVRTNMLTIDVTPVKLSEVELFVKLVYPKFQIGDVIIDAYPNSSQTPIPMRVHEIDLYSGEIHYRDEWSMRTGCAGGRPESGSRLATPEEKQHWAVK